MGAQRRVDPVAAQLAVGADAAARAFLQQRQVRHVEREAQVRMRTEAAVGVDARVAELHAHVLQLPLAAGQREAGVATGVPAAHVAADVADAQLQRAIIAKALSLCRGAEIQVSADPRPQPLHVDAVYGAAGRPARQRRPAHRRVQLRVAAKGLERRARESPRHRAPAGRRP